MTDDTQTYPAPADAAVRGPRGLPAAQGLYDPRFEKDACGVGFICHIKGQPSHQIVSDALKMLENMDHRGACGCEENSGDGAGIMIRTPDAFFRKVCREQGVTLPPLGQYGVGMLFLPQDAVQRHLCERIFERVARENGMKVLGWRDVPVDPAFVGPTPKRVEPRVRQVFVSTGDVFYNKKDFDRRLYLVRQRAENEIEFKTDNDLTAAARDQFYICILSGNRMIYKGMLTATQLRGYYKDLSDPDLASAIAIVHSRFSTNTFPSWALAHPFRYLAHNGEINTLRGNRNWMRARYGQLQSKAFGDELQKMFPILTDSGSDSATLDNMVQFLAVNGRSLPHAVLMAIPEAWQNNDQMDPDLRAFYEYHACLMEPWDGPASITFTNGSIIGAVLDRNGLRPSRFYVTKDDTVIMASEVGVLPVDPERVLRKGRLQPGKIFLIDLQQGRIIDDKEIKDQLLDKRPWRRWLDRNLTLLESVPDGAAVPVSSNAELVQSQHAFGYTNEDLKFLIGPMGVKGIENTGSMGTDTPLACLSDRPQPLFNYFKQLFAQVTNPPLDANFESLVTSLFTYLGREPNLLDETPRHCRLLKLKQPVLSSAELAKIKALDTPDLKAVTVPMLFDVAAGEGGLGRAVDALCATVAKAVADGATLVILSDRGVDRDHAPIPSLLATAAVHHHLSRDGTRTQCGLVIETGEAREAHHFCLLIGYGAGAVNPYVALETLADMQRQEMLGDITAEKAEANYLKAANKSIIKVASKMGISTVQSYRGAQIFEAVGIAKDVIDVYFRGTASRIQGVGLDIIAREALMRHHRGFPEVDVEGHVLDGGGNYQWRRDGEYHMWNPDTVAKLQQATKSITGYPTWKEYAKLANDESQHRCTIRGLMTFKHVQPPVKLEDVEPAASIVKRFVTGAMSFGSISAEAHETLAIAMNRIGGKSNSGEGGEDSARFTPDVVQLGAPKVWRRSAIKQVASARFGVTAEYLVNAEQLQIKMAQGAKPGEGGQLPGDKVDETIGRIRHSTPGVGLISPPPHHDIYSIEDLAQLIHDLKSINPAADVSVKLVSEVGVGTIAAGVAKAKADHILIAGDGGGTGASPLTSIKHCGLPWELGLAETQQTLVLNGLRGRVYLQVDGQMKTGRDVAIGALLGAEEFGFSTGPLIASGCIMMRVCHLNTCPVGIATQDPELRKKFTGQPEHVVNFMFFVAEELREIMAELGFTKLDDMVGRTDVLDFADLSGHWKAKTVDLFPILHRGGTPIGDGAVRHATTQDHGVEHSLDSTTLLPLAEPALAGGEAVDHSLTVKNTDRSVGATLAGEIAKKYGNAGLPDGTITFRFTGSAGQSFGCFAPRGVRFLLEGDANDYVGKGLCGGQIAVYPPRASTFDPARNIIAGNTILYGATEGEVYLRGVAGERFAVRNSGASAVVEGVGDHGCEYMTGGTVVVIGPTGRNFAAGMSGGVAYVYDDDGSFPKRCNPDTVSLTDPLDEGDRASLRQLLESHYKWTASAGAKAILDDWDNELRRFVKVFPNDYRRVIQQRDRAKGTVTAASA